MYLVRLPFFIRWFYPQSLWRVKTKEKVAYLTFDDGPIPEVTPWVLELLKKEKIKATFFCVGENVKKHPEVYQRVISEGHRTGNHTFNHLQSFRTPSNQYLKNIEVSEQYMHSKLFRPPHGQLRPRILKAIQKKYSVVFWDLLSCDFDASKSPEDCFEIVRKKARPGSVIVFHDSLKAEKNMKYALQKTISHLKKQGYRFELIPE